MQISEVISLLQAIEPIAEELLALVAKIQAPSQAPQVVQEAPGNPEQVVQPTPEVAPVEPVPPMVPNPAEG